MLNLFIIAGIAALVAGFLYTHFIKPSLENDQQGHGHDQS